MKKIRKNILIGLLLLLGLVIVNILNIVGYFHNRTGNEYYEKGQYDKAYTYYKKADNIAGNSALKYDIANSFYKQQQYEKSLEFLDFASKLDTDCKQDDDFCLYLYHNLGNVLYRIGEKSSDTGYKVKSRESAVSAYKKGLEVKYDQETKENLEFVLNKLDELRTNENSSQQQNGSGDQQQQSQSGISQEQPGSGDNQQQNGSGSSQGSGSEAKTNDDSSQQVSQLSDSQKLELQKYVEYLKQQEAQNQQNFNKKPQDTNSNPTDIFSQFFGANPFDNNTDTNKKDW